MATAETEHATLELRSDKKGEVLELPLRQQRLIQLQHPAAARVVVKKLHGGFSGSLVLQTFAYDEAGRPDEPAVTKLDAAAALVEEVEKQDSVSGELGPYAIRILRRPLYLGASGVASTEYMKDEHETDADGAVVLELAGACWVLPEFFGKVAGEQELLVTFKAHLVEALETGVDSKNCEGVFDDLYAVGGPVQRLASKPTFGVAATDAKEGFVATTLEDICREIARSMVPAQDTGHGQDKSTYSVPASLLEAATGLGPLAPSEEVTGRRLFAHSFVHECDEQVWGDAACAPLIALAKELRASVDDPGSSWLASWRPLRLEQHGDLNAANVLLDVRGQVWLIDFAKTGTNDAFCDAAKLISTLLFEYLPSSDEATLRRGCAVIDALIPADGARQLWEPPSPLSESTPAHELALSLAAKVQHAACDMIIATSRRASDGPAADVHPAALWLPLLHMALRCLRFRDLNVWQKRTAWHAVQRLSTASLTALQSQPVAPPEKQAVQAASLKLEEGRLLLLRARGSAAEAARLEGGSPADNAVYEVKPDGLHRLLLDERMETVPGTLVTLEDMLHTVHGDVLPDAVAVQAAEQAVRRRAAELFATRDDRAMKDIEEAVEQELKKEKATLVKDNEPEMTEEDQKQYKRATLSRLKQERTDKILLEDEEGTATELRKAGVFEQRRYGPGQQLSVLYGDRWHDMTVLSVQEDGTHEMSTADSPGGASDKLCLGLHAFNHAPLELHEAVFTIQRGKHEHRMSVSHASIRDALSGRQLSSLEQCVPIGIAKSSGDEAALAAIRDVDALCSWLHDAHARRQFGERGASAAVLLTAPPAAGKTCLVSQLVMHTLRRLKPLVPLVIKVMDLQHVLLMEEHKTLFASKWNWADAYFCATLGEASPNYRFLRQALLARRALLMLDGMDEGGQGKTRIERHVKEVLLPQGHPMLLTSRPDSLVPEVYKGCARLQLLPLTAEQQRAVIAGRLHGPAVPKLVEYVQSLPSDTDGNLLSGNPLMLNMLVSIYESRGGGMPSSLQQVYEMASSVMLGRLELKVRGGSATTDAQQLRRLLREVALEVHLQKQRQISAETLFRVAKRLGAEEQRVCEAAAEQLALDRMPMLSMIEREPLVVQFSHLSFQEYFAAQAICAFETKREGLHEPWRWEPWWGNAVRLGADCGKPFGLGLLRAAGLEGTETLDLSAKLEKGSMAAIAAVVELIKWSSVASLNVDGHALLIDELKGTKPTEKIDLSNLGVASGFIIAACIKENGVLKELNIAGNMLTNYGKDMSGMLQLAEALPQTKLTSLNLGSNELCGLGIGFGYTAEGITALCKALKGSAVTSLDIASNDLTNYGKDMTGVLKIAEALPQTKLTALNLYWNNLGPEGGAAIAEGLKGNTTLKELNLTENQLCGLDKYGHGTFTGEGITALCEGLKGSAVTSLNGPIS